jgi:hypothetical protein
MITHMSRLYRSLLFYGVLAALFAGTGLAQVVDGEASKDEDQGVHPVRRASSTGESGTKQSPAVTSSDAAVRPKTTDAARPWEDESVAATLPPNATPQEGIAGEQPAQDDAAEAKKAAGIGASPSAVSLSDDGSHERTGGTSRVVHVTMVIIGACAAFLVLVWVAVTHHSRRIRTVLGSDAHTRTALLDRLTRTKDGRLRTESALLSAYRQSKDVSLRIGAIEALCAMTDSKGSGRDVLRYLDMAFQDDSGAVRRSAYELARRKSDADIIKRLISQLPVEQDSGMREMILTGVLAWKEKAMCTAVAELRLDEAEAGVRGMLAYGFDQEKASVLFARIAALREQKAERDAVEATEKRVQTSQELTRRAAAKLTASECDAAEELIRQALSEYPANAEARSLLGTLPELRNQLAAADKTRLHAALLRQIQNRQATLAKRFQETRGEFERLMAAHDLDAATDHLIQMAVLDPSDGWVKQMLAQMPSLQDHCRLAIQARTANERLARIAALKAKLEDHWQRNELEQAEETARTLLGMLPHDDGAAAFLCRIAEAKRRKASDAAWAKVDKALREADLDRAESALRCLPCCDDFDKTRVDAVLLGLARLRKEDEASLQHKAEMKRKAKAEELRKNASDLMAKGKAEEAEPFARELVALIPHDQAAVALADRIGNALRRTRSDASFAAIEAALRKDDLSTAERLVREALSFSEDRNRLGTILEKIPALHAQARQKRTAEALEAKATAASRLYAKVQKHFEMGELDDAEESARQLIALVPDDQRAAAFPSRIAEARARMAAEKAWSDVSAAMAAQKWAAVQRLLQSLILADEQKERAERVLQQVPLLKKAAEEQSVADKQNQVRQAALSLREDAMSRQNKGDLDGALAKIDGALAMLPTEGDLSALQQEILSERRHKQAESMLSQVQTQLERGEFDQAEASLRALLPIADDPSAVHRMLDDIPDLRQKHQASAALADEVESQAVSLKALKEAQKLFEQGKLSEAATKLRRAIASDPMNERAAKLLQRVFQFDSVAAAGSPRTRLDSYGQIVEDSSE